MTTIYLLLLILLCSGCIHDGRTHHKVNTGINLFIGQQCHPSALLKNCNVKNNPPTCKVITLKYDDNCEQISVVN